MRAKDEMKPEPPANNPAHPIALSAPPGSAPSRVGIISWLAAMSGGHNAGPPVSWGRLCQQIKDMDDDEAVARYLYNEIRSDAEEPLKAEIVALKAKLYDLQNAKDTCEGENL